MKLEAKMAKFIINEKELNETGTFHYENIIYLENLEDYPNLILGKENAERQFVSQSHFRGEEKGNNYYVLVFKIVDIGKSEDPGDYSIRYTPIKGNKETQLKYDSTFEIFFDPPKFKKRKGKYSFDNKLGRAAIGSISTGAFYVNVYKGLSEQPINIDYYKVYILPSSLPISVFKAMLNDILQIQKDLIMEKSAAKQSIQTAWEYTLDDIEKVIDKLESPLLKISKEPRVKLTDKYEKVLLHSIKKFNGKTLMNILVNQGSNRIISNQTIESTDIYENRMIYYALSELKKYVESIKNNQQLKMKNKLLEGEQLAIQLAKNYGMKSLEKLGKFVQSYDNNSISHKLELFQVMDKTLKSLDEPEEDTVEVEVEVRVNILPNFEMNFIDGRLMTKFTGYNEERNRYDLEYKINKIKLSYSLVNSDEYNSKIEIEGRKAEIELLTSNLSQHLFLYNRLNEIREPTTIRLHGIFKKNNRNNNDPLRGGPVKKANGEYYKNTYHYPLKIIELKAIDGLEVLKKNNEKSEIKELFIECGRFPFIKELKKEIKSVQKKNTNNKKESDSLSIFNKQTEKVLKRIDFYLNIPMFKEITLSKSNWHLTQIFINDNDYSQVWKQLRRLDESYYFTTDFQDTDLLVKKTDQLYEYWIFIILIRSLLESGWKIRENTTLLEIVNNYLNNQMEKKKTEIEGINIQLEHAGGRQIERIQMTIYFNTKIGGKEPDYAFEIEVFNLQSSKLNPVTKWFYLDAKYRSYDDQGGQKPWYNDINVTAIGKYTNYFKESKIPTNAAFIIHPDINKKYTYFGGYMNETMTKHLEPIKDQKDRNPLHQFGSFACLPGYTKNLQLFIRMILEYHFVSENTPFICFGCGSAITDVEKIVIQGSKKVKYHISCECGDFWVRTHCDKHGHMLIKHSDKNYHQVEYNNYPWYVKCPACDLYNDYELY